MRMYLILAAIFGIIVAGSYYMTRPLPQPQVVAYDKGVERGWQKPVEVVSIPTKIENKAHRKPAPKRIPNKHERAKKEHVYTSDMIIHPVPVCEGGYSPTSGTNFGSCKLITRTSYESPGDGSAGSGSSGDGGSGSGGSGAGAGGSGGGSGSGSSGCK